MFNIGDFESVYQSRIIPDGFYLQAIDLFKNKVLSINKGTIITASNIDENLSFNLDNVSFGSSKKDKTIVSSIEIKFFNIQLDILIYVFFDTVGNYHSTNFSYGNYINYSKDQVSLARILNLNFLDSNNVRVYFNLKEDEFTSVSYRLEVDIPNPLNENGHWFISYSLDKEHKIKTTTFNKKKDNCSESLPYKNNIDEKIFFHFLCLTLKNDEIRNLYGVSDDFKNSKWISEFSNLLESLYINKSSEIQSCIDLDQMIEY